MKIFYCLSRTKASTYGWRTPGSERRGDHFRARVSTMVNMISLKMAHHSGGGDKEKQQ